MTPTSRKQFNGRPLTNDDLRMVAPSIFATKPWEKMSSRYAFIPTIDVIERLRSEGFLPFAASQSYCRTDGKGDYTKHMVRLRDMRNGDRVSAVGNDLLVPEVLIINAHDGGAGYSCINGIFRFVCENGLVVCDGEASQISVRHVGNVDGVIDATYSLVEEFPKILESVERFSAVRLEAAQQEAFGAAALALKYDEQNPAPMTAAELVKATRQEDAEPTLWNTLNTAQEKLIGGGVKYKKAGEGNLRHKRMTTRPVKSITEGTKLNKALWTLAEKMRELVA